MIRPSGLWLKILLVAFLNLVILLTIFFVVARQQFRLDLSSILLAPARDRMISASRLVALELPGIPANRWDEKLAQYSSSYPAELFLFDRDGSQLAGKPVQPPESLFPRRPPPPEDRPPARDFFRPPPPENHLPPLRERMTAAIEFQRTTNPTYYWASVRVPLADDEGRRAPDVRVVWRFTSLWTNSFFFDYRPWLFTVVVIAIVSVVCWLPLIRSITHAISAMTNATGQIAEGHFEVKLPVNRHDELGRLSDSINQMAHRLSGYVNGQRRFLGDIAHELCSPVARIQLSLGILEQRSNEVIQPYVAIIDEEVQHMSSLVNELLSFSKASLGASTSLEVVSVSHCVNRAIERERTDQATIEVDVPDSLAVLAQPEYLVRALSNVLRNAIRYAAADGPIEITARQVDGAFALISVADQGPGVPPEELEEILKPFYRPETARQRETGGVGLGLAIVRTCVEACGGSVTCRNRVPKGFLAELRLPIAGPA
jgi:two-component system sensor histidine kinase CpxA